MLFFNSLLVLLPLVTATAIEKRVDGINIGYLIANGDHVAWFSGHPKSDRTDIGPSNVNPCTRTFNLKLNSGGTTGPFQMVGCGGPVLSVSKNGQYYATCTVLSEPDADGVYTQWHCS